MRATFEEIFSEIEDPRIERTKRHKLLDILGVAILSVIAGAQSFGEIEDFGNVHFDWFKNHF